MEHALKRIINYETFSPCIVKLTALQVFFQLFSAEPSKQFMAYLRYLISSRKVDLTYFMETNFTQNLNLEEMAKLTGRSLSAFKKDFAKLFDTSPQRWLLNRRLEKAHYLLSRTDTTVAEIAYECGFENTSHFSRAYKLKYGETPTTSRIAITVQ
ncbi:Exoenzyme S synthesis regulatory protein ExsA [compost metagenome]